MTAATAAAGRLFTQPMTVGSRTLPPLGLVVLAAIGAMLLVIVAVSRWAVPTDELAYWLGAERLAAGEPLYDLSLPVGSPYAYWYPPPLAQVLAPFTTVVPDMLFVVGVDRAAARVPVLPRRPAHARRPGADRLPPGRRSSSGTGTSTC